MRKIALFVFPLILLVLVCCPASALRPGITGFSDVVSLRGPMNWQVILCQFKDSAALAKRYHVTPQPQRPVEYYQDLFFSSGTHGLQDWVRSVSYGLASVSGSVHGWYTEPQTWEQARTHNRRQKEAECVAAAASPPSGRGYPPQPRPYVPPNNDWIYVITSPGLDLVGFGNQFAIAQDWGFSNYGKVNQSVHKTTALRDITHEFGHGMNLAHSFNNDLKWKPVGGAPGEYGNSWDIMSDKSAFGSSTTQFGAGAALLNAHHLNELGWIPMNRIINIGQRGPESQPVKLAALTHPEAGGYLLARVLFDEKDRWHYYTVEYRVADGYDAAISDHGKYANKMIQINEIAWEDNYDEGTPGSPHALYVPFLERKLGKYAGTGSGPPVQSLDKRGVTISVKELHADYAIVVISTKFRPPCAPGYVWRGASPDDSICVTPQTHEQMADENKASAAHTRPDGVCTPPYVWRGAYTGDAVCVTKEQREQVQADNGAAETRLAWIEYGPLTCLPGYVWRAADNSDYVCVTPQTREQTADENKAYARSGGICAPPYVARGAFPGDAVCVTQAQHEQALSDNAAAAGRVVDRRPPAGGT